MKAALAVAALAVGGAVAVCLLRPWDRAAARREGELGPAAVPGAQVPVVVKQPAMMAADARPGAPGKLRGIAGLRGFEAVSRISFVGVDDPHTLTVLYHFPDRARWTLRRTGTKDRQIEYRFGDRHFVLGIGERSSARSEGAQLEHELRKKELRRAVLFWPDGFAWSSGDETRSAPVPRRSVGEPAPPIGTLHATLDAEGRPVRVEVRSPDGSVQEALLILAWQTVGDRLWPARMRLELRGNPIWDERVESIETGVFFVDSYFLPPDQKHLAPQDDGRALTILLRTNTHRTCRLARGTDWPRALAREAELRRAAEEELRAIGLRLDPVPSFELRADGRPGAVVLRLTAARDPAPQGWTTVQDSEGRTRLLADTADLTAELLRDLGRDPPAGLEAGTPFVRFYTDEDGPRIQVSARLLPP